MMLQSGSFEVGECGIRVGDYARIGWNGETEPWNLQPTSPGAPALARPATSAPHAISCTTAPTRTPAPAFDGRARTAIFDRLDAHPAGKGRSKKTDYTRGFDGPAARLELFAPTENAEAPTDWTLRWMDPFEPGEPVHTWKGKAPPRATWYPNIQSVAAARGRVVLASLDHGMPAGAIAIGTRSDTPVVWVAGESGAIVAWAPGGEPHAIATYAEAQRGEMAVGLPDHGSVPLLLSGLSRVALRRIALDSTHAAPLFVDGWAGIDPASGLGACPKGTEGDFSIPAPSATPVQVDGVDFQGFDMAYTVHASPGMPACIAGFQARLTTPHETHDAQDKTSHLRYLVVPELANGTGVEEGGTPHLRTVRCQL
jgi:hypothetical protein